MTQMDWATREMLARRVYATRSDEINAAYVDAQADETQRHHQALAKIAEEHDLRMAAARDEYTAAVDGNDA